MNNILKHLSLLHNQELYSNIVTLAELTITFCDQKPDFATHSQKFQLYIYYAQAQFQLEQYAVAEKIYNQALQTRKFMLKVKGSSAKDMDEKELMSDLDIKFKIYQCFIKLKQSRKAVEVLENIPARSRTPKVNMALGNLYKEIGKNRSAITCFKEILKECPLALEAAQNLLKLDVQGSEVNALMINSGSDLNWLNVWLKAEAQMYSKEFSNAIATFKSLDVPGLLHDNVTLLVNLGYCYTYICKESAAITNLQRAVRLNPYLREGRDLLACLLVTSVKKDHLKDLEKLLAPGIDSSLWPHEYVTVMGFYMYSRKKYEEAAYYAQQVCKTEKSVDALVLSALVRMQSNKYYEAAADYREALLCCSYRIDLYRGLVQAYLATNRLREATAVANNACKQLSSCPAALTLYASVLLKDPMSVSKARGVLEKAIAGDQLYVPAIHLLVEHLEQERLYEEAVEVLKKYVDIASTSKLHQLLANCYARLHKDEEAFHHYHVALRLDPTNQGALEGLDNIGQSSLATSKIESSCYMTAREDSNAYPSQTATTSDRDGDPDSDTDNWPNNSSGIMSFSV